MAEFDEFAAGYNDYVDQSLKLSGEDCVYFARKRMQILLESIINERHFNLYALLDFGCGTGNFYPIVTVHTPSIRYLGVDVSSESIDIAQKKYSSSCFSLMADFEPDASFPVAYCNGVFHHIDPEKRADAVRCVYDSLSVGGIFSFWENNPYNLGTRYIMSRNPFDKNAVLVSYKSAEQMLKEQGFRILRTDFYFYFPAILKSFRRFEFLFKKFPFGAQYQVLAIK